MRELALHILDLIENSIRAGSRMILITIDEDRSEDRLRLVLEDDGPGLPVSPDQALDPFYTTKTGKKVGLGLSLMRAAAERSGGGLRLGDSTLGGVRVEVEFGLSNVDRAPLGDLAATLSSVVCTNPGLDLGCRLRVDGREQLVAVSDLARELHLGDVSGLAVARKFGAEIRRALQDLNASG
jgi:hypothetical protein